MIEAKLLCKQKSAQGPHRLDFVSKAQVPEISIAPDRASQASFDGRSAEGWDSLRSEHCAAQNKVKHTSDSVGNGLRAVP